MSIVAFGKWRSALVSSLIAAGADVNVRNTSRDTVLMCAASRGCIKIVRSLIECHVDVNIWNDDGETALMKAADEGYTKIVDTLLQAGADVNICNKTGETALMLAAAIGHKTCLEKLIDAGADVNSHNCKGGTALMKAVSNHNSVRCLIEAGADVNIENYDGWTALMYTVSNEDSLKCLIEGGADMNKQNKHRETALSIALTGGFSKSLNQLVEVGADINIQYKYGDTILGLATTLWRKVLVKSLITAGANVDVVDFSRNTLLHCIFKQETRKNQYCSEAIQCIKLLLGAGAKVNMLNVGYIKALTSYFQLRNEKVNTPLQVCLSTILTDRSRFFYSSPSCRPVCSGVCESQPLTLLFAAGETVENHPIKVSDYLDPPSGICLSHICREVIREHLLQVDPHGNLFCRVQRMGLPSALQEYLLYNVSLDDDGDDDSEVQATADDDSIATDDDDD